MLGHSSKFKKCKYFLLLEVNLFGGFVKEISIILKDLVTIGCTGYVFLHAWLFCCKNGLTGQQNSSLKD